MWTQPMISVSDSLPADKEVKSDLASFSWLHLLAVKSESQGRVFMLNGSAQVWDSGYRVKLVLSVVRFSF